MSRILEYLSQASPDEELISGTKLAATRVQRVVQQLRQRMTRNDKAGNRARRLVEYLEGGGPNDARFEGISIPKLQSAVERAQSAMRARANNPIEDSEIGHTLRNMTADLADGDPGDTWVDGVNVTRLALWLARLERRARNRTHNQSATSDSGTAPVQTSGVTVGEADQARTPSAGRIRRKVDAESAWTEDFLE